MVISKESAPAGRRGDGLLTSERAAGKLDAQ
jgi:hypothetical protein